MNWRKKELSNYLLLTQTTGYLRNYVKLKHLSFFFGIFQWMELHNVNVLFLKHVCYSKGLCFYWVFPRVVSRVVLGIFDSSNGLTNSIIFKCIIDNSLCVCIRGLQTIRLKHYRKKQHASCFTLLVSSSFNFKSFFCIG